MASAQLYPSARIDLIAFLKSNGFRPHPLEVFCPSATHCWVDVAAVKGQDSWAFEYKSRSDSIRRGFEQCRSYSRAFNYVVLVADRHRVTSSPYFGRFRKEGFGVWRRNGNCFLSVIEPKRRSVSKEARVIIERQFRRVMPSIERDRSILDWVQSA